MTNLDSFNPDAEKPVESKLRASDIRVLLKRRYSGLGYALFFEVANATGANHGRSADAIVMDLYPSRGLELHGFEVKVDRGDFLRELKDEGKSDAIAKYMDRWWVVAGDRSVARVDELPRTWGLLAPDSKKEKLRVVKQAPPLKPEPLDREFLAAMLRRAAEASPYEELLRGAREDGYKEGREAGLREAGVENTRATVEYPKLLDRVQKFEDASGVNLDDWYARRDPRRVGQTVRILLAATDIPREYSTGMRSAEHSLEHAIAEVRTAREKLEAEAKTLQAALPKETKEAKS